MTINYNKDGWVTERYPYNLPKGEFEIEITDEQYTDTLSTEPHFAWRVVNGQLVNVRYEETPIEEQLAAELRELEQWFEWYDIQITQYQRSVRLETPFDQDITVLDAMATQKAQRIRAIREIIK